MAIYTYLMLNLFTVSVPLARSFEPRIAYYKQWKHLFTAIGITGAFFLVWDFFFTKWGIWSFNHNYVIGWDIAGMPLEEWLFFLAIPFACVFIYEVLKYFFPLKGMEKPARIFTLVLSIFLLILGLLNLDKLYTSTTFISTSIWLLSQFLWSKKSYFSHFYLSYFIALLPFFMVNGVLTSLPVVSYNDLENLGIRLFTIPIEDTVYMLLLLMMNVGIYEHLKKEE